MRRGIPPPDGASAIVRRHACPRPWPPRPTGAPRARGRRWPSSSHPLTSLRSRLETMHNTSSELVHPRPTTLRLATACVYVARMLVGNSSRRVGGVAALVVVLTLSAWLGAAQATPLKVVRYH